MKKIFKLLILIILCIPFVIEASSGLTVNKNYINSEIEIAGALKVKQLIELEGNYNRYELNFDTKYLYQTEFTGLESDLKGSTIYNPTNISQVKVGVLKEYSDISLSTFNEENFEERIAFFEKSEELIDNSFNVSSDEDGVYSIIINEAENDSKNIYYLEYLITNVLVEHKDCAEFFYPFLNKNSKENIKDFQVSVALPYPAEKVFKVYAHGPRQAIVSVDEEKRGVISKISNYKVGTDFDIRILFDREFFSININDSKRSKMEVIDIIDSLEQERTNESNKYSILESMNIYGLYGIQILYIIITIGLIIYILIKKPIIKKNNKNFKLKLSLCLFGLIGLILFLIDFVLKITCFKWVTLILSIMFIISSVSILQKTSKK